MTLFNELTDFLFTINLLKKLLFMPLSISNTVSVPLHEIVLMPIRAQGAGGQNVNKVSSAIHLRFDINNSSLPEFYKERLLSIRDSRLTDDGVIVIKAQQYRTQEKNREDALERLALIIRRAVHVPKNRKPTRPSGSARKKRVDSKTRRGKIKSLRKKVTDS
ncbi:MAG: alternative ribosome rescue aminoacyl-tRNA hydrolase ArfB [Desulforhopalus sp.]